MNTLAVSSFYSQNLPGNIEGSHIYWKTWKNIVHLENLVNHGILQKKNKNHGNIMKFCQFGYMGNLGYRGNGIFLIR